MGRRAPVARKMLPLRGMRRFHRILVPVDFSMCSRVALEHALSLAHAFNASLDLVHVWSPQPYPPAWMYVSAPSGAVTGAEFQLGAEKATKDALEQFLEGLEPPAGVDLSARTEQGSAAEVIARLSSDYDLVVMGTHGRTGLTKLVLGSVAAKVVAHAECPVLTVRQPAGAEAAETPGASGARSERNASGGR